MPTVRIVIPTYNRAHIVGEALESVLTQTFSDFEVVVTDDGSTDDTAAVVQHFVRKDSRIRLLQLSHGGAAQARNEGIRENGQYTYLAFLDSDDLWFPQHLERAIEVLAREPTVAVFFSRVDVEDLTGKWTKTRLHDRKDRIRKPAKFSRQLLDCDLYLLDATTCRRAFLFSQFAVLPTSAVIRAEAVKRAHWFNSALEIFEDLEFFLFMAVSGNAFVFDDTSHAQMRRFGDNLTGGEDLKSPIILRRLHAALIYSKMKLSLCSCAEEVDFISREIAETAYLVGQCCAEQWKLKDACLAYRESLRNRFSCKALRSFLKTLILFWKDMGAR